MIVLNFPISQPVPLSHFPLAIANFRYLQQMKQIQINILQRNHAIQHKHKMQKTVNNFFYKNSPSSSHIDNGIADLVLGLLTKERSQLFLFWGFLAFLLLLYLQFVSSENQNYGISKICRISLLILRFFGLGFCFRVFFYAVSYKLYLKESNYSFLQQLKQDNKPEQMDCQNSKQNCEVMVNQIVNVQNQNQDALDLGSQNKTGHWSLRQNAKYYAFLKKYREKFSQRQSRRQCKVFKALAEFMKTRNANQCRSHHHKMQKNFDTIQQNLAQLLKKNPSLQKKCQKYLIKLQKIQSIIFGQQNQEKNQKIISPQSLKEIQIPKHVITLHQIPKDSTQAKKPQNDLVKTADSYDNDQNNQKQQQSPKQQKNKKYENFPSAKFLKNPSQSQSNSRLPGAAHEKCLESCALGQSQLLELSKFSKFNQIQTSKQIQTQSGKNVNINNINGIVIGNGNTNANYCHQLFCKWYAKVEQLIRKQQTERVTAVYSHPNRNHCYPYYY